VPPNLSWDDSRPYAVLQSTLDKDCRQAEEPKQLADEASWFQLERQRQTLCGHLLWCFAIQQQSTAPQSGHALLTQVRSMCSWTLPCVSSLVPSILHLSQGFQCSPTLNRQPYEGRLPLTSWRRKSSNMTVGQSSLTFLAHFCYDRHPESKPLWLDLQPVDIKSRWRHNWKSAQVVNSHLVCDPTIWQPGFDLHRQQWSLLNRFHTEQGHCGACRMKATYRHWSVSLWRDPDNVSHCRILFPDKTEWRLISATLCGWRRCFVADQLWLMTRIREEKEEVPDTAWRHLNDL